MLIHAGAGQARIAPRIRAKQCNGYSVSTVSMASLRLEQAEDAQGARHLAFLAEGVGAAVVSREDVASARSQVARVLARDPEYARSVTADGATSALWLAAQGQAVTPFGNSVLVSRPADPGEPVTSAIGRQRGLQSAVARTPIPSQSLPMPASVSQSAFRGLPRVPAVPPAKICPFTFAHKEISLDGAEITFKRPANALILRFCLDGFRLVRNWRGISLRASEGCRLTVLTGAQSVLEETFFVPPHQFSDKPELPQDILTRYLENEKTITDCP